MENLTTLRISTLEEDDEEQEQGIVDATTQDIDFEDDDDDDEEDDDDDDDGEDDDEDREPVTLGFAEKPKNRWSLLRHYFPSKAGGVPAWLDPINLPSGRSCVCDMCGDPLQFLLQVYAPISGKKLAFHRTVFVFVCPSKDCLLQDQQEQCKWGLEKISKSVKVFRSQLPHVNPFYLSEPPRDDGTDKPLENGAALCNWCGTWKGHRVCTSCRRVHYCSEKHQAMHWHSGHDDDCRQMIISSQSYPSNGRITSTEIPKVATKTLWPEYEIIKVHESNKFANMLDSEDRVDKTVKAINNFEGDAGIKSRVSFETHSGKATGQVLRYCRSESAKALWPESSGQLLTAGISDCSYCGGPRIFEFQILPQLLYYIGVKNDGDSLDWATIAVYTCEASCGGSFGYQEELAWVQLSS